MQASKVRDITMICFVVLISFRSLAIHRKRWHFHVSIFRREQFSVLFFPYPLRLSNPRPGTQNFCALHETRITHRRGFGVLLFRPLFLHECVIGRRDSIQVSSKQRLH